MPTSTCLPLDQLKIQIYSGIFYYRLHLKNIERSRMYSSRRQPLATLTRCGKSGEDIMDMDKPDGQGRPGVANIVAAVALVTVVLGYVVYLNSGPADVRSELPRSASFATGIEGGSAPGNAAGANSNSPSQQRAADAGAPASPELAADVPQNAQSKPASLSANDIAYVQKRHANIRSEPRERGSLAGRAYKGTKLSVVSRSGKWVQVESGETKGWVSAKLIGPRLP
jgi:hypothetical protein